MLKIFTKPKKINEILKNEIFYRQNESQNFDLNQFPDNSDHCHNKFCCQDFYATNEPFFKNLKIQIQIND